MHFGTCVCTEALAKPTTRGLKCSSPESSFPELIPNNDPSGTGTAVLPCARPLRPHQGPQPALTGAREERGSPRDQVPGGEARPHASARPGAHLQRGPRRPPAASPPARRGRDCRRFARTSVLGPGARQPRPPPEGGSAPSGPVPAVRPPPCRPSGRASRRHFACVGLCRALCVRAARPDGRGPTGAPRWRGRA